MTTYQFKAAGKRLSNWGRWGAGDDRGTLNFLTPQAVRAAAGSVRTGQVLELSIPIGSSGPQLPGGGPLNRVNPVHLMNVHPSDFAASPDGLIAADDYIFMPLQSATHWDSLAHVGYDGHFYNGVPAQAVTAVAGASANSIDRALPGPAGRGVLLDIARLHDTRWLAPGHRITPDQFDRAAAGQGLDVTSGDILLVRTGWRRKALDEGWAGWMDAEPGLDPGCAQWISDHEIAAVASDNWALEALPANEGTLPLHSILLHDMGMMIGENFNLEELASACAADGRWDFLFSAPPLRITSGTGSPASPIAIR
jgi:kynurenine formamidase